MEVINAIPQFQTPVITGEIVAGEAAKKRQEVEKVILSANGSMFDLMELLHYIKVNNLYQGFNTFSEYLNSLKFKRRRLDYLVRTAEVMAAVGVDRKTYEPLGLSKLRIIATLDVNGSWRNPETNEDVSLKSFILGFIKQGQDMTLAEIQQHVRTLKGEVGEEAFTVLHVKIKLGALDKTIRPALEYMKMKIGSISKDNEGFSKDASDGRCLELICADFLSDPANTNIGEEN